MSLTEIIRDPGKYAMCEDSRAMHELEEARAAADRRLKARAREYEDSKLMHRALASIWREFGGCPVNETEAKSPQAEAESPETEAQSPETEGGAKYDKWTEAEDNFLIKHYRDKGAKWCAAGLGRSFKAVFARAQKLRVRLKSTESTMTPNDEVWLRAHWCHMTTAACAMHLGTSRYTVTKWAAALGLPCKLNRNAQPKQP